MISSRDLLENMLQKKPSRRLTLQQVIMHRMRTQPAPPSKNPLNLRLGRKRVRVRPQTNGASSMFAPPPPTTRLTTRPCKKMKAVTDNEIFHSISGNAKVSMEVSTDKEDVDVMATKWGNDVFEMVDEADIDSDYDSDSVDDDSVDGSVEDLHETAGETQRKKGFPAQSNDSASTMQNTAVTMGTIGTAVTEHSEMSHEEEVIRPKRFKKVTGKSNENMLTLSQAEMLDQVPELKRACWRGHSGD